MTTNLSQFSVFVRPYKTILGEGYAVVIPFNNKEDCLNFIMQTNLTLLGIDDDVLSETPLGPIGMESMTKLMPDIINKVTDNLKDKDHDKSS